MGRCHDKTAMKERFMDIVLGIPGLWPTRSDLIRSVASQTDGLLLAGFVLLDTKSNIGYQVDIYEHDPALVRAFRVAGAGWIDDAMLETIARHTRTLYLIGPGGTPELALEMMKVTAQLLNAGGLALKVETAGVAHSKETWQGFATHGISSLSSAFTAYVKGHESYYSCGMHNLGLPDAAVSADMDNGEASQLLRTFLAYISTEHPVLADGHTFSVDAQSPRYRLTHQEDSTHPADNPFHNPHGLWRLSPVES
jgi:hypothetical protein